MSTIDAPPAEATFDVVVVGSGGGGLTAAVSAASRGLRVVVLEKSEVLGGTTAISGGGLWIPVNPAARRLGLNDSLDDALTYVRRWGGDCLDMARVDAFLVRGPEMVEFLERETEVKFDIAHGRPDYHPGSPGFASEGRTIHPLPFDARALGPLAAHLRPPLREMTVMGMMVKPGPELRHFLNAFRSFESARFVARKLLRHGRDVAVHGRSMDLANGNALVGRLLKSALDRGVTFMRGTAVTGLLEEDGRIAGVHFRTPDRAGSIRALRGVVLAAGGFPLDVSRRRDLYRHAATGHEHWSPAPQGNTGDTLRMAELAGAHVDTSPAHPAAWAPVSVVPTQGGGHMVFAHLIDRQKPGFIIVDRHARRFTNEAGSYHEVGKAIIAANAGHDEAIAYLVADARAVRRYGMGAAKPAPIPLGAHLRSGYLKRGSTLGELARALGIDAAGLEATVAAFNRHAVNGEDPEFGKGGNEYNRYNGDAAHAPNPCLAPIVAPPFYAVQLRIGELGTFAGLATDASARVLRADGSRIEGLYAAGNDAATVLGGDYMSGGATLGPGMTWGYIAGREI